MQVRKLFSYRKKVAEGKEPDIYVYDSLPNTLRNQIIFIWRDALPTIQLGRESYAWKEIHNIVAREHGVLKLEPVREPRISSGHAGSQGSSFSTLCQDYLRLTESVGLVLDLIEVSFSWMDAHKNQIGPARVRDAIDELNERFLRAGVGYRFEEGRIIRIDSELIHAEIVKPAFRFLSERGFEGPRNEFLEAHDCYRNGKLRDAITNANSAFESTLKTVCEQRQWPVPPGARASDLLKIVSQKGLFPSYLEKPFDQFLATLKSGLPKIRNEDSTAHGQGARPRTTPRYVAAYALHLAAANIHFVAKAHKATIQN